MSQMLLLIFDFSLISLVKVYRNNITIKRWNLSQITNGDLILYEWIWCWISNTNFKTFPFFLFRKKRFPQTIQQKCFFILFHNNLPILAMKFVRKNVEFWFIKAEATKGKQRQTVSGKKGKDYLLKAFDQFQI
jgi:hypothetical protein